MKPPFGIKERKCKKSDYRFVRGLIRKTLYPYVTQYYPFDMGHVRESFNERMSEIRILMKGKRRIGFYQLSPRGKRLEVTRIYLTPRYQGKGIGTFYMRYFETLGFDVLFLVVLDNNPARLLYKKLGYKVVAEKKHRFRMEKRLK